MPGPVQSPQRSRVAFPKQAPAQSLQRGKTNYMVRYLITFEQPLAEGYYHWSVVMIICTIKMNLKEHFG